MNEEQQCPICNAPVPASERYPNYVCDNCYLRAADEEGRSLSFSNASLSGGFAAIYQDTHEESDSHECYIDGIKCRADESGLGGIVIQPIGEQG